MTEKVFVDSNILVYAHDADAGDKQRIAADVVAEILDSRLGVLSNQVLQDFYSTVTRKLRTRSRGILLAISFGVTRHGPFSH